MTRWIQMDLKDIVEGCKSSEPESIKALYELYSDVLMKQCMFYVKSPNEAYDLFHDAFLIIISKIGQLRDPMKLEFWIISIVRNLALQYLKDRKRNLPETEMADVIDEDESPYYQPVPLDILMSLIDRLPQQYGNVFRMSVLDGMSHKEIGAILGIEERTSSANLFRARAILKAAIKKYWAGMLVLIFIAIVPFMWKGTELDEKPATEYTTIGETEMDDSVACADTVIPTPEIKVVKPLMAERTEMEIVERCDSIEVCDTSVTIGQDSVPARPQEVRKIQEDAKQYYAWDNIDWAKEEKPSYRRRAAVRLQFSNLPGSISRNTQMNINSGLLADLLPKNDYVNAATKIDSWTDLERVLADLAQNYPDSTMYTSLHSIAMSNANAGNDKLQEEREYAQPITAGITASFEINRKWSVITGLEYSRLSSRARSGIDSVAVSNRQVIHYLGIPVGASYSLWNRKNINIAASAYGRLDIPVASSNVIEHHNGSIITYTQTLPMKVPLQWSLGAGLCFQYTLGANISIYAEPQLQYHFTPGGNVPTTWTERPLDFAVPIGIRFNW